MFSKPIFAYLVHLLTASTAVIGLLTLIKTTQPQYIHALWLMGIALLIDAIDGTLARYVNVKKHLPLIDGALLDNICDFLNYVITPCFFLLIAPNMLISSHQWVVVSIVTICSCYQFTQSDAKTEDHFFKGFPCYWNIVVLYLFLFHISPLANEIILIILSIMIFVPIKYVYPSRLDYLTEVVWLKRTMQVASVLYGISCFMLLIEYPRLSKVYLLYSASYVIFYLSFSIFRTLYPMLKNKIR